MRLIAGVRDNDTLSFLDVYFVVDMVTLSWCEMMDAIGAHFGW